MQEKSECCWLTRNPPDMDSIFNLAVTISSSLPTGGTLSFDNKSLNESGLCDKCKLALIDQYTSTRLLLKERSTNL